MMLFCFDCSTGASTQLHKRTQFVASEYRQRVLQALDFRNRFAKRPFLCEELLSSTQNAVVRNYLLFKFQINFLLSRHIAYSVL